MPLRQPRSHLPGTHPLFCILFLYYFFKLLFVFFFHFLSFVWNGCMILFREINGFCIPLQKYSFKNQGVKNRILDVYNISHLEGILRVIIRSWDLKGRLGVRQWAQTCVRPI